MRRFSETPMKNYEGRYSYHDYLTLHLFCQLFGVSPKTTASIRFRQLGYMVDRPFSEYVDPLGCGNEESIIRVRELTPELIEIIRRARVAISQQKPRYLKCRGAAVTSILTSTRTTTTSSFSVAKITTLAIASAARRIISGWTFWSRSFCMRASGWPASPANMKMTS